MHNTEFFPPPTKIEGALRKTLRLALEDKSITYMEDITLHHTRSPPVQQQYLFPVTDRMVH